MYVAGTLPDGLQTFSHGDKDCQPLGKKCYKYFYSASLEYSLDVPTVQVMVTVLLPVLSLAVD